MTLTRKNLVKAHIESLVRLAKFLRCEDIPRASEGARSRLIEIIERRLRFHGKYQAW